MNNILIIIYLIMCAVSALLGAIGTGIIGSLEQNNVPNCVFEKVLKLWSYLFVPIANLVFGIIFLVSAIKFYKEYKETRDLFEDIEADYWINEQNNNGCD